MIDVVAQKNQHKLLKYLEKFWGRAGIAIALNEQRMLRF